MRQGPGHLGTWLRPFRGYSEFLDSCQTGTRSRVWTSCSDRQQQFKSVALWVSPSLSQRFLNCKVGNISSYTIELL